MLKRSLTTLLGLMLCLFIPEYAHASSRTKNDIVYMRNGDKITCEIKSLAQGQLTVKPDYTDQSIVLDWRKVDRIESSQQFVVTDPNLEVYTGSLTGESETKTLTITEGDRMLSLDATNVVEIDQLGTTFMKRLKGNADLGLSFARSNSQRNLTFQTNLGYQSAQYLFNVSSSSQFATQEKTNDTNEASVKSAGFKQLRESRWYAGAIGNFLSSSEQQISLRSTIGAAIARRQVYTNKTNLSFIGGLAFTHETDSENATAPSRSNAIDGAVAVQFSTFRFDAMTFNTSLWTYPSITSAGRVRITLNQDIYYKFLGDFYVRMSFYDNYDNRPVVGAPSNNLGATTTLGWSFH